MVLSPGSGRKNAPRDANGHFVSDDYQEPLQDIVIPEDDEDISPFQHIEHPRKRAMLMTYSVVGKVREAAEIVGVSWVSHYYWLQKDPEYAQCWKLAEEIFAVELEDECTRRGKDGVESPVFDKKGNRVGSKLNYSDLLLIFRTKAQWRAKYGDNVTINIEDRVRQLAEQMGLNPDEVCLEAQKLLGPGKSR